MNTVTKTGVIFKVPLAFISFKLDASVYKRVGNELERIPHKYLKRNTIYDVVQIDGDVYELSTGEIVKGSPNNPPILFYGKIIIKESCVEVFTRNGLLLRTVEEGQQFNVYAIHTTPSMTLYKINQKEFITQQSKIEFVRGYFKPSKLFSIVYKGRPFKINPSELYSFNDISGSFIRLNGYEDLWIDLSVYDGEIEKA